MPEKIAHNLYRLPIPLKGNALKELNAYLILGKDRNLLIDTGFNRPSCRDALFSQLEEFGLHPGDVDVLLSHSHSDHTGLAKAVSAGKSTVYISRADERVLDSEECNKRYREDAAARFVREGFPPSDIDHIWTTNPSYSMSTPHDVPHTCIEDGDILEAGGYKLKCLSMPGHTPGLMCFWDENSGILFTSDHVLFDISPNITAWKELPDSLGSYMSSLKHISQYYPALCLPGHRKSGNLQQRVTELLAHHEARLEETLSIVKLHPGISAYEVASYLTWKTHVSGWAEFPLAQKWFAVGEATSHLMHLVFQNAVQKEVVFGVAAYTAI